MNYVVVSLVSIGLRFISQLFVVKIPFSDIERGYFVSVNKYYITTRIPLVIGTLIRDIPDIIKLIGNTYHLLRLSMSLGISMGIYYTTKSTTWAKEHYISVEVGKP